MWRDTQNLVYGVGPKAEVFCRCGKEEGNCKCSEEEENCKCRKANNLYLDEYGSYMKSINICFGANPSRTLYMNVFQRIRHLKVRHLEKLTIRNSHDCFQLDATEYCEELKLLLQPAPDKISHLKDLNLSDAIVHSPDEVLGRPLYSSSLPAETKH